LIVLTNLHNPSSALVGEETLRRTGEIADSVGARVLVDEVYLEAIFENAPRSSVHLGPQFMATSSLTKGYGLSGLRCGWILAEPELAERMRLLHDIFGAVAPHPAERLSVLALRKLPKFIARAKNILESNRAVLNDFLDSREELTAARSETGTTCFPRLEKGSVDSLWTLLNDKYETAFVPGRFLNHRSTCASACAPNLHFSKRESSAWVRLSTNSPHENQHYRRRAGGHVLRHPHEAGRRQSRNHHL